MTEKLSTCLWFDDRGEEAANFYVKTFRDCGQPAEIVRTLHWGNTVPGKAGKVLTVDFILAGRSFVALDGGPNFAFTPAVSTYVLCEDQAEIDRFWNALGEGGSFGRCGWLTDRFGLSWQIAPRAFVDLLHDPDVAARDRAMAVMMTMDKLNLAALTAAHRGG